MSELGVNWMIWHKNHANLRDTLKDFCKLWFQQCLTPILRQHALIDLTSRFNTSFHKKKHSVAGNTVYCQPCVNIYGGLNYNVYGPSSRQNNKISPAHLGAILKSPIPSSFASWHVRVAVPFRVNPLLHEAVHVSPYAVIALQSVLPSVIFGGESHVIAEEYLILL